MDPIEILLVEDNPADADLTIRRMKEAKALNHISAVENGTEALAYLRKQGRFSAARTPRLILLDLNLPGMSGQDVLREIRQDQDLALIPVVILTSSEAEEDIALSYQLQANAYICKPVDLQGYRKIANAIDAFWLGLVKFPPPEGGDRP